MDEPIRACNTCKHFAKLVHEPPCSSCNIENDLREPADDPVEHPAHYTSGGVECIDAIKASMTPEEFKGFLKGNTLKYLWRYPLKGKPLEDLKKAQWYLDRLIGEVDNGQT